VRVHRTGGLAGAGEHADLSEIEELVHRELDVTELEQLGTEQVDVQVLRVRAGVAERPGVGGGCPQQLLLHELGRQHAGSGFRRLVGVVVHGDGGEAGCCDQER
jgi:hypothetical protein